MVIVKIAMTQENETTLFQTQNDSTLNLKVIYKCIQVTLVTGGSTQLPEALL